MKNSQEQSPSAPIVATALCRRAPSPPSGCAAGADARAEGATSFAVSLNAVRSTAHLPTAGPPQEVPSARLYIKTYGCQMNERDSEHIAQSFVDCGYQLTDDPSMADVILLNTCSVRDTAERKAIGKMGFMGKLLRKKKDLILGYFGCMAQARGSELLDRSPFIHIVAGTQQSHHLPDFVKTIRTGEKTRIVETAPEVGSENAISKHLEHLQPAAHISIMQGCNLKCAYCIVPRTRGPERSRPAADILEEARTLAARGTREITLLGQIVNRYCVGQMGGTPAEGRSGGTLRGAAPAKGGDPVRAGYSPPLQKFTHLLDSLATIPGIERLRFTSPHPIGFGEDLIAAFATNPKLCEHIHLPLQSGSNPILRAMRRGYTIEKFQNLVAKLRTARPDIAITTDIIVGFPGETDEDFQATYEAVREIAFDNAFIFRYSPRIDTPAPTLDNQIPETVKIERNQQLLALVNSIMLDKLTALVGTTQQILCEGYSHTTTSRLTGRTRTGKIIVFDTPVHTATETLIGQLLDIRILRTSTTTLYGEML